METLQDLCNFPPHFAEKIIRYAGGREHNLGDLVPLGFLAGINGMLIGNYFTTQGRGAAEDLALVARLGLNPAYTEDKVEQL